MDRVQKEVAAKTKDSDTTLQKLTAPVEETVSEETEKIPDVSPSFDLVDNDEGGNHVTETLLTTKTSEVDNNDGLRKRYFS